MNSATNSLEHNQDLSLDEILSFIDSYDFAVSAIGANDQTVDSINIEDSLTMTSEATITNIGQQRELQSRGYFPASQTTNFATSPSELTMPHHERGRVRERVLRLRRTVKHLEWQLEEINRLNQQRAKLVDEEELNHHEHATASAQTGTTENDSDVVTWQQLALRQYAARREAENENMKLRERLEEQVRVAKRLERIPEQLRMMEFELNEDK